MASSPGPIDHPSPPTLGALLGMAVWYGGTSWDSATVCWAGVGIAGVCAIKASRSVRRRWKEWSKLRAALHGPGKFGQAEFMSATAIAAGGLTATEPTGGLFVGAHDGALLFLKVETHGLTVAPAGGGKTSGIAVPNVLHAAALAEHSGVPPRGMVITDKDGEVTVMCWPYIAARLPASACINPFSLHGLPNHCLNPLQDVVALTAAASPEAVDVARKKALVVLPEPEHGGDAKFFRDRARDLGTWITIYFAAERPTACTLPDIYDAINGGDAELISLFRDMQRSTAADGQVAKAGARYLSLLQNAERTFAGVISELQNALSLWDSYSTLGRSVRHSDFNPGVLKEGPAIVFLVIPEDKVEVAARHIALLTDMLVQAVMRHPSKRPEVVFLLDEFQRLPVMPSIPAALYRGRGSGLIVWPIIQDLRALRAYGKDESAFRTQADFVQLFGIRAIEDAQYLETRIGQTTLRTVNASLPSSGGNFSLNHGEQAAPRLRKDEILQTPRGKQFIIFREHPVILADIVPWWLVDPWRRWPAPNPKEGAAPPVRPEYHVRYVRRAAGGAGATQTGIPRPKDARPRKSSSVPSALAVIADWFWFPALVLAAAAYFGLPSLRVAYSYQQVGTQRFYTDCAYAGFDGRRVARGTGDCPLVAFTPIRPTSRHTGGGL